MVLHWPKKEKVLLKSLLTFPYDDHDLELLDL